MFLKKKQKIEVYIGFYLYFCTRKKIQNLK